MKISIYDYCRETGREYLLSQWHPTKNGVLTPQTVAKTSRQIIWWRCEKGHEWCTQAVSRINGTGCPECYKLKLEEKRQMKMKG